METILLVEDDQPLASHWQEALEAENYRVIHERSAEAAIDVLDSTRIDLVITDIVLQSADEQLRLSGGLAVISYIALNLDPQPKIIATSGNSHSTFVVRNFSRMNSLQALSKPLDVEQLITSVREILATERSKTSQAKREIHDALHSRMLLDVLGATDGVWDWRIDTDDAEYSAGWREMLGFEGNDTKGFPNTLSAFVERVHPRDRESLWESVNQALSEGTAYVYEFRLRHKNDSYIWVQSRGQASFDAQGKAIRLVGATHNITRRKLIERELAISRAAIDNSGDAVFMANQQGEFIYVNETACKRLGYSREELLGMTVPDVDMDVPSCEAFSNEIVPLVLDRQYVFKSGTHRCKDGSVFPVEVATTLVRSGDEIILCKNIRDISERREHEVAILQAKQAAEHSEERYRKIAEDIQQLNDELKRSNQDLEQFAYVASHDLLSPLRGIANISSMIREDDAENLSGSSQRYFDKLEERVRRMETLVNDLLVYARAGKRKEKPQWIDVGQLLNEIIELLDLPDRFIFEIEDSLPRLHTYPAPLRQVFLNLIGNAIKHHDRDAGTINLSASQRDGFYLFKVADDGPGIDVKYHGKIFELFQQLESPDKAQGSGMGLALVRRLVKQYGGDITIDSGKGRGSVFEFAWPRVMDENTGCG